MSSGKRRQFCPSLNVLIHWMHYSWCRPSSPWKNIIVSWIFQPDTEIVLIVGCELNIYANKPSSLILIMRMEKLEIYQSDCFIQKLCLRMHIILNSPPRTLFLKVITIFEQTAYHLLTGCRLIVVGNNMISEILHHENTLNELIELVCSSTGWHLISILKSKMAPNMSNRGMSADLQLIHPR